MQADRRLLFPSVLAIRYGKSRAQSTEWYHPRERGFSWWPGSLAQHVWAEPPYEDEGIRLCRIHIRTDLLHGVPDGDTLCGFAPFLRAADLSGLVWSGEGGTLQLASRFYVHEQTEASFGLVAAMASALQAAEAHSLVVHLAEAVGGVPAVSAPPGRSGNPPKP